MWLVVGGLAVMLWSRSRFKKQDGVFATKMRLESGSAPGVGKKWPPMSSFALWVHDVLMVHKGLGLMNTCSLGVAGSEGSAKDVDPEEVKRLGENPGYPQVPVGQRGGAANGRIGRSARAGAGTVLHQRGAR